MTSTSYKLKNNGNMSDEIKSALCLQNELNGIGQHPWIYLAEKAMTAEKL
jgi:hypothetical protein